MITLLLLVAPLTTSTYADYFSMILCGITGSASLPIKRTIAVAGTSGKSTVTAMIFEFLTACDKSPSLISGAGLRRLEKKGMIGNAWSAETDLLVGGG